MRVPCCACILHLCKAGGFQWRVSVFQPQRHLLQVSRNVFHCLTLSSDGQRSLRATHQTWITNTQNLPITPILYCKLPPALGSVSRILFWAAWRQSAMG